MSSKKSVAKSIRISEELNEFIESYPGKGFNDKLNNIINLCFFNEVLMKQRIAEAEKELNVISKELSEKRSLISKLQDLEIALNQILPASETETQKEKNVDGQETFF